MWSGTAASPTAASGLYSDDNEAALTRVIAHCRRRAQPSSASRSRTPAARPRRSGRGRAAALHARAAILGDDRAVGDAVRRRTGTCRATRRWTDIARVRDGLRQLCQALGADRVRRDRTALRPRLSGAFVPVAGVQPAHRPIRRLAGESHALRPRDRAGGARGGAEDDRARRAHHRQRLARRRAFGRRRGDYSPRRSRPTGSTTSTCRPAASPPTRATRPRRATTCRSPSGSSARPASPPAWSA